MTVEAGLPLDVSSRERRRVAIKFGGVRRREAGREARRVDDGLLITRVLVDARYARDGYALVGALRRRRIFGDARLLRRVEEIPQLRVEVALLSRAAAHGGLSSGSVGLTARGSYGVSGQRARAAAVRWLLHQCLKRGRGQCEARGRRDKTALAFQPEAPAPLAPVDVAVEP